MAGTKTVFIVFAIEDEGSVTSSRVSRCILEHLLNSSICR